MKTSGLLRSEYRGELKLGTIAVDCHVLETGQRVMTQRGVWSLLLDGTAHGHFNRYISRIPNDGKTLQLAPIVFSAPNSPPAHGYEATDVIDICKAYYDAWRAGMLQKNQIPIAQRATDIMVACGKVGIIALIDEVTGYQEVREANELQIKVQAYLRKDLRPWNAEYPEEFWVHMARLVNVQYTKGLRVAAAGRFIREQIYDRLLGADVMAILKERNKDPKFGSNHHQYLQEVALKKLRFVIAKVIGQLETCQTWSQLKYRMKQMSPGVMQIDMLYENE